MQNHSDSGIPKRFVWIHLQLKHLKLKHGSSDLSNQLSISADMHVCVDVIILAIYIYAGC